MREINRHAELYGRTIRQRMDARKVTTRQLAKAAFVTPEQIRRLCNGDPVGSRNLNEQICILLKLDEDMLWRLAQKAKAERAYGPDVLRSSVVDSRLEELWLRLDDAGQKMLLRAAEGLVVLQEATLAVAGGCT